MKQHSRDTVTIHVRTDAYRAFQLLASYVKADEQELLALILHNAAHEYFHVALPSP
jgi:hypothetical protein